MRSYLGKYAGSGPDPDDEQFKRMRQTWLECGDEVVAFRRRDVNEWRWLEYQSDAAAIYGPRRK